VTGAAKAVIQKERKTGKSQSVGFSAIVVKNSIPLKLDKCFFLTRAF
jgi:hypothetical protein